MNFYLQLFISESTFQVTELKTFDTRNSLWMQSIWQMAWLVGQGLRTTERLETRMSEEDALGWANAGVYH